MRFVPGCRQGLCHARTTDDNVAILRQDEEMQRNEGLGDLAQDNKACVGHVHSEVHMRTLRRVA